MDSLARIPETCRCLLLSPSLRVFSIFFISRHIPLPPHLSLSLSLSVQFFHLRYILLSLMDSAISPRRPYFVEGDDGLASLADMEVGFSGTQHQRQPFLSRSCYSSPFNGNTRNSFRSATVLSPRSGRFFDARLEEHRPHFLESCFYCKKPLGNNKDIFMYRGDTPFCSEDCRQEQIEIDEANENNQNLSSSMKALRKKEQRESASPNETQDYPFRTSTIAAA